jgi:hypothetical protein
VPKLDLGGIIADQLKAKAKAKSSGDSSESGEEECEVDESIMEDNLKFMFNGTPIVTERSLKR